MTATPCLQPWSPAFYMFCWCNNVMQSLSSTGKAWCGCTMYNTSILSRRPIAAIIPPPNPTTLTPASLSSQLLISLTTKCSLFSSVDSTVQGRRPQGLAAVKWNQSNQMTFSTTYLRSLTLRRDLVEKILSLIRTFPIEWDLKLHAILEIMK